MGWVETQKTPEEQNRIDYWKEFGDNKNFEGQDKRAADSIAEQFDWNIWSSVKKAIENQYAGQLATINANPDLAEKFEEKMADILEWVNSLEDWIDAFKELSSAFETVSGSAGWAQAKQYEQVQKEQMEANKKNQEHAEGIKDIIKQSNEAAHTKQVERKNEQKQRDAIENKEKHSETAQAESNLDNFNWHE